MVAVDPVLGAPVDGSPTATTIGFDELGFDEIGESTGVSRCAITMAGKTALVGLASDGINRILTPSPADLVGSERETLVPASDVAELEAPAGPVPVAIRKLDGTVGKLGKLGSDGGNRGASTLGNGAIDWTAKLGAGVAEAGLVAMGVTTVARVRLGFAASE